MKGAKILLIDGQRLFAEALSSVLEGYGAEIVGRAYSGSEGVKLAAAEMPDVTLLDLRLPDRSGLEVGQEILLGNPLALLVALTGVRDASAEREAIREGFRGFIPKDTRLAGVVNGIREVLAASVVVIPSARPGAAIGRPAGGKDARLASDLTERERDVLVLIVNGASSEIIADRLGISRNTVRTHVQSVLTKLQVHSRLEAASFAVRHGIVDPGGGLRVPA